MENNLNQFNTVAHSRHKHKLIKIEPELVEWIPLLRSVVKIDPGEVHLHYKYWLFCHRGRIQIVPSS